MGDRNGIRDPHWWFYGGGALMGVLFGFAMTNQALWSNPAWRGATWLTAVMTGVGLLEILLVHGQHLVAWATGHKYQSPYLRPRALAFARKLRAYYDKFKDDPEMPRLFFAKYYDEIAYFQRRLYSAGAKIDHWLIDPQYLGAWMDEIMVDVVISEIELGSSQVAEDIPA